MIKPLPHRSGTQLLLSIGALLLSTAILPDGAYAGNGTFKDGKYNFCVSVRFHATDAELQKIRTAFQNASQVFADATDGQQRFDTVTIVNDSGASQSVEYWVNSGPGRAGATGGKYGVRGEHVNLYFDSNFQGGGGGDGDAYTIAHEHSHHAFGVIDEYAEGSNGACAPLPDTPTLNFCLMDNYFTRGGNAGGGATYTLNEYCVQGNHDPDEDTGQEKFNHQSCWETIAAHPKRGATAPAGLPTEAPPAAHTVTFHTGLAGLRVMLLLDRSGSMVLEDRLAFAKLGAKLFVEFVKIGDGLGVASFSSAASVDFPLTTIADASTRTAAKAAVDSLVAGGNTNIGGGLLAALGQITGQAEHSCNEIIVLLSDGDHNVGTPPSAVIGALQDAGVTVLTVGLGSGITASGEATLQNIASQTGGKYFRVNDAFSLVGLFLQLVMESTGNGLLTRAPEAIAAGQTKETPVSIEEGAAGATFGVTIADPADAITLSLRTPSGVIITQADAGGGVQFIAGPNSKAFQIQAPEAGTWTMRVAAGTITTGVVEVFAFAEHDGVALNVSVAKDTLVFPETAQVDATPTFGGENVVGATVAGNVTRPDGSIAPIMLFDDGLAVHGDRAAGDGIYASRFNNYSGNGTYTFEVTVVNVNGVTYSGESLFSFVPPNSKSVPPFTRTASTTAVVSGVPAGGSVTELSPAHLWIGLKNGDDQGTQFDLKVELLKNGAAVASGLARCITGVTRNPAGAKETIAAFDPFSEVPVTSGDVLALKVSTRIGTNPNGTRCAGPGGSHGSAVGLRLYYDSGSRASRFDMTVTPSPSEDFYLHSDGGPCPSGDGQSPGVTARTLDEIAPTAASAKCKDSGIVNFAGGNPFSAVGTWSLPPLQ